MEEFFSHFGHGAQAPGGQPPAPGQPPEPDRAPLGPTGAQPIAGVPADSVGQDRPTPIAAPEIVPGIPLWTFENPYGDRGISWLADLDLDATHEVGQPTSHAGMDGEKQVNAAGDKITRSGGAASYINLTTGRGFTVPVNLGGS